MAAAQRWSLYQGSTVLTNHLPQFCLDSVSQGVKSHRSFQWPSLVSVWQNLTNVKENPAINLKSTDQFMSWIIGLKMTVPYIVQSGE